MIDRFGRTLLIAWSTTEDTWLSVAQMDGPDGLHQLAELTGRSYAACYARAWLLGFRGKKNRPKAEAIPPKPSYPIQVKSPPVASPSALRPLTKTEMMTGGLKRRVSVEVVAL